MLVLRECCAGVLAGRRRNIPHIETSRARKLERRAVAAGIRRAWFAAAVSSACRDRSFAASEKATDKLLKQCEEQLSSVSVLG